MQDKVKEGWEAVGLLKNELLQRTLCDIQNQLIHEWMGCTGKDQREELWAEQRGISRFKSMLKNKLVGIVLSTDDPELKREMKTIEKYY